MQVMKAPLLKTLCNLRALLKPLLKYWRNLRLDQIAQIAFKDSVCFVCSAQSVMLYWRKYGTEKCFSESVIESLSLEQPEATESSLPVCKMKMFRLSHPHSQGPPHHLSIGIKSLNGAFSKFSRTWLASLPTKNSFSVKIALFECIGPPDFHSNLAWFELNNTFCIDAKV